MTIYYLFVNFLAFLANSYNYIVLFNIHPPFDEYTKEQKKKSETM